MKIAILLETNSSGGGSFTHSVNTCLDLKRSCKKKEEIIVYTQFKNSFEILKKLKIPVKLFSHSLFDKILLKISVFKFFRIFTNILNIKTTIEKTIIKNKNDLIFFPVLSDTVFCLKKIDLIKIDTEGYELEVLVGAKKVISKFKPKYIQIEYNWHHLFKNVNLYYFSKFLKGYQAYKIFPFSNELMKINPEKPEHNYFNYSNIVFIKK